MLVTDAVSLQSTCTLSRMDHMLDWEKYSTYEIQFYSDVHLSAKNHVNLPVED